MNNRCDAVANAQGYMLIVTRSAEHGVALHFVYMQSVVHHLSGCSEHLAVSVNDHCRQLQQTMVCHNITVFKTPK